MNYKVTFLFLALLMGCHSKPKEIEASKQEPVTLKQQWTPPAPGEIVAEYSEKIEENRLNDAYFKVIIRSTENSKNGIFDLELIYEQNENTTTLELPEWTDGIVLKPVIKKGENQYECLIGFEAGTHEFLEFYIVVIEDKNIRMTQTRIYYL